MQNLRRLLTWVDIGQYLDKEYNHYDRWKQESPPLVNPPPFFDEIVHRAIDDIMNQVKADVPDKSTFYRGLLPAYLSQQRLLFSLYGGRLLWPLGIIVVSSMNLCLFSNPYMASCCKSLMIMQTLLILRIKKSKNF